MKKLVDAAIVLAVTILIIFLLEVTLRAFGMAPQVPPHFTMAFVAEDQQTGFKAIPNAEWSFLIGPTKYITGTTDKAGYRPAINDCRGCQKILVVGDSITFGAEAPDDQTWPELVSQELQRQGLKYYTRNISFRGWNTAQVVNGAKAALKTEEKVTALLYFFSPNDPAETFSPLQGGLAPLLRAENDGTYKVAPPDFAAHHKIVAANQHLGKLTSIKYHSAVFAFVKRLTGPAAESIPAKDWSDAAYRSFWKKEVWQNVMHNLRLLVEDDEESRRVRGGIQYLLNELSGACRQARVKFYVAFLPFGTFTQGTTLKDFQALSGYSDDELNRGIDQWHKFGQRVREMTEYAGGVFLPVSPDTFAGMTYRQYAAAPDDWHYSLAAHNKVAVEVSKHLAPALGR
jgi:hypothetical protein